MDLEHDPIVNAVYGGMKRDIQVLLEAERWRGALLLIYAGIDSMAWVGMESSKDDVGRKDFVAWCDRYLQLPGKGAPTGLDLYGARCALLHNYSIFSALSREGACRAIGYTERMEPPVVYRPGVDPTFVMVSLHHLAEAFFSGIDQFLMDVHADPARRAAADRRLGELILSLRRKGSWDDG
jgi:hypothetical protein